MNKLLLSAISALLLWLPPSVHASDDVTCEVNHSLYHGNVIIKASYRFILAKGSGVLVINGQANTGQTTYVISREIRFAYSKKSATDYFFINDLVHKNPLDNISDALLTQHYPAFFISNGNSLTFHIQRVNKNDFVMSFVSTPFFYCNGK